MLMQYPIVSPFHPQNVKLRNQKKVYQNINKQDQKKMDISKGQLYKNTVKARTFHRGQSENEIISNDTTVNLLKEYPHLQAIQKPIAQKMNYVKLCENASTFYKKYPKRTQVNI